MKYDRVEEILKELDLESIYNSFITMRENNITDIDKAKELTDQTAQKIIELTKNDSLAIKVALLYRLRGRSIIKHLLELPNNEEFIRAQLVLEFLRGNSPELLLNNLSLTQTISTISFTQKNFNMTKVRNIERTLDILHQYLKDGDFNTIKMQFIEDLNMFACCLDEVVDVIFNSDEDDSKSLMLRNLFVNDYLLPVVINAIYNEVIINNKLLRNYDFAKIILEKPQYLVIIKGLYRKANSEFFESLCKNITLDEYLDYNGFFQDVINLNQDDEQGLRWFFMEIEKNVKDDEKFYNFLKEQDYFKKYRISDIDEICHNNIIKLLNGEHDLDGSILYSIGESNEFLDNYDKLLDLFVNSEDLDYQRDALIPLIMGLIEKQKRKYNLDFKVVFSSTIISNHTLGTYNHEKNIMYINPNIFSMIDDPKTAFAYACETVFHETRHAKQYIEVETNDEFNFNNLVMAIDFYSSKNVPNYNTDNYRHLSFERDARAMAYVDTMTLFKDYPSMQERTRKQREDDYHLSDFIRKETSIDHDVYYGIIYHFLNRINISFKIAKEKPEFRDFVINRLKRYPVLFQFFNIDLDNLTITIYDGKYYSDLLLNNAQNSQINYSVKAFLYALNVSRYLDKREWSMIPKEEGYNQGIIEEIDQNVRRRT